MIIFESTSKICVTQKDIEYFFVTENFLMNIIITRILLLQRIINLNVISS